MATHTAIAGEIRPGNGDYCWNSPSIAPCPASAVVGLLLCGVVIGPHVLGFFGERAPIADFFAELGKLLLMFFAGLEIDIAQFRQERNKSVIFGLVTTLIPLLLGTAVGLLFGYQPVAAIVWVPPRLM